MPKKRHEELRAFGMRLLAYMGITDIRNEEWISVRGFDNKEKRYRIDLIGYLSKKDDRGYIHYQKILVEVGNNHHDKIANLRLYGYLVIVIPYSEKEEEWQDEKKLLEIMIKSNEETHKLMCRGLYKACYRWEESANEKIKVIDDYEGKLYELERNIQDIRLLIDNFNKTIRSLKKGLNEID